MTITLIILCLSAIMFALGRIRSDIVALCALILLLIFGILTPEEALAGFSNQVVIMMAGLFIVGGGILQTGLAKKISGKIMQMAGSSELKLSILVVLVTAFIGAFVSNTGTVALMLPIVVSLASSAKINASKLLMPLAFASSMGGMLTLIGTPPNLVIQETLVNAGYESLEFFSFLPIGLVCIAVGILVMLPLSHWLLSKKQETNQANKHGKTLRQLVNEYKLTDKLSLYIIGSKSPMKGKTVGYLNIHNRYGLSILEVRRQQHHGKGLIKNINQRLADVDTILLEGDVLYLKGDKDKAIQLATDYKLTPVDHSQESEINTDLKFYDIGIAEIVLLQSSAYVNRPLRETSFRAKYNLNVIGIRRSGEYIMEDLPNVQLRQGDVLLVQASWQNIARLSGEEEGWVVMGQPLEEASRVTLDYKAPLAALIMIAMVAMMVFDFIPIASVTAVLIAAVMMILAGCFRNVEAAYKTINWESIILIAAMMPMSTALEKTGASSLISHAMVDSLGGISPLALLAGIYVTTSILTMFISNTATAVLMSPIALTSAISMGYSPYPFLFAVAVAASMCFASPFATPPNALVMQAGRYSFMDYVKVGLPLQLIMCVVMVIVLPLLYPFT